MSLCDQIEGERRRAARGEYARHPSAPRDNVPTFVRQHDAEHAWRIAGEAAITLEMERRIGIYLLRPRPVGHAA